MSFMKKVSNGVATKKDITKLGKKTNERMDFLQTQISEFSKTILERMGDLIERIDATNKKADEALKRIDAQGKRQDAILEELRSNRIVLGSHEQRLQKVEFKILSP